VRRVLIPAALAALLLTACGKPSQVYSLAKTRSCLRDEHARLSEPPRADFVAGTSTGGAMQVRLRDNVLTLVFGATVDDADAINDAYQRFHNENVGIADVLRQQGNAVMLWRAHPSNEDVAAVAGCLK
jgi:hypothetical protein